MRRAAIAVLGIACVACSRAPERDLFEEGETLFLDGKYDAAIEVFKQRLLERPNDAGAHFYLGTSYLNATVRGAGDSWLGIAQGELETALSLFERSGKVNPVPRFSAEYFEVICHVSQAKIYLVLISTLVDNPRVFPGVDPRTVIPALLKKCIEQADMAERVAPDRPEVADLKKMIEQFRSGPPRAPRPAAAPRPAV